MKWLQFYFLCIFIFVFSVNIKAIVKNFYKPKGCIGLIKRSQIRCGRKSININTNINRHKLSLNLKLKSKLKSKLKFQLKSKLKSKLYFNTKKLNFLKTPSNSILQKWTCKKQKRIYFERNGVNIPKDISMFGKTNIYYIRENIYNQQQNNLKENEITSFNEKEFEKLEQDDSKYATSISHKTYAGSSDKNIENLEQEQEQEQEQEKEQEKKNNLFTYLNKESDYVIPVGNSPKVDIYKRVYSADEKTLQRIFENINEVNLQLLKNIKSIDEKEKLINKLVIEKVQQDVKKYQDTNEIMDIKGNIMKPAKDEIAKKTSSKKKNVKTTEENDADLDEEEKNELLKKLYINDKKTDKYLEENVYFVIQIWVPDLKIDDTLIVIDNIEKGYNDYDIATYYEKFHKAKQNQFFYDLDFYKIDNIPQNINDDKEIECEHVNSYNNSYNKLNNYNMKKYTYTYTTNENADTKFNKNEPMPPIILINTKKNSMVQEWEAKIFKNRLKRNKSHQYTRIQRAFRPFSYIDLSNISCIYKYNYLQIKMKLCHRKYKNEIYPFFVPINTKSSEEILDFNGYKQEGDNAWSFFWHNFNYDKETDYMFLNKNIKLNVTETKFEEVNKKKSKKIMRHILQERKGK